LNASLRLHADRFFTKNYNAETYTQELLDYIDQSTFKSVLQNNVPELVGTDLDKMINGFEIWDPDGIANKDRHPLQHAAKVSSMFK
jgi:alpha-dioxygenase